MIPPANSSLVVKKSIIWSTVRLVGRGLWSKFGLIIHLYFDSVIILAFQLCNITFVIVVFYLEYR